MKKNLSGNYDIRCINCGGKSFIFWYKGFDRLYGLCGEFDILECKNCGLYSIYPKLLPQDMAPYYPENYICYVKAVEDETNIFKFIDRWRARERRVKRILKRSENKGRILDVGCATGILLSGLQRYGWECYGVEPNFKAAEYARNRFGLDVFNGNLEDAGFQDNYFDIITMIDVLEHIHNPIETIKEVFRILKPGGYFFGNIPNAGAWERYLFGPYWVGWDVPRHYHIFTQSTIRQLLEKQGFLDVDLFSYTGRHGAFMLSIKFWLEDESWYDFIRKLIKYILGSLLFRILLFPIFILIEQFNRSTTLSFSAKKD